MAPAEPRKKFAARPARERAVHPLDPAAVDEALLLAGAAIFRNRGLDAGTLRQVAEAANIPLVALTRAYPTREHLIQAIFDEALRRQRRRDRAWNGYGAGMRLSLETARSFQDGYLLLARDAAEHPGWRGAHADLRRLSAARLRSLLWHPDRPPPQAERPAMLDLVLEPMIAFSLEALSQWLETGSVADDERYIRWCAQTIRDWRHNAAELLNLDSPEHDWPFDTDGLAS